jgi:hypothetical protein
MKGGGHQSEVKVAKYTDRSTWSSHYKLWFKKDIKQMNKAIVESSKPFKKQMLSTTKWKKY